MKRRYFRYRLTTLLGLMVVIALAAGAYGNHRRALQRQDTAVELISKKGGEVRFDRYHRTTRVLFQPTDFGGCGQTRVTAPEGNASDFVDDDLKLLDDILVLEAVKFTGSSVSRDGMQSFGVRHPGCKILRPGDS